MTTIRLCEDGDIVVQHNSSKYIFKTNHPNYKIASYCHESGKIDSLIGLIDEIESYKRTISLPARDSYGRFISKQDKLPARDSHGRFISRHQKLPARDSHGRFISKHQKPPIRDARGRFISNSDPICITCTPSKKCTYSYINI